MTCTECRGNPRYHQQEADRIEAELCGLDPAVFGEEGIVRTVLRERLAQEQRRSQEERRSDVTATGGGLHENDPEGAGR